MLTLSLLQWWYTKGWLKAIERFGARMKAHFQAFSVVLLLRTLFAPWKQIVAYKDPNATIAIKLRHLIDNLVSRCIGFVVRVFTLIASLILAVVMLVVGLLVIGLWPLIPLISVGLALKGLGLW